MDLQQFAVDLVGKALDLAADEADVFIQSGHESEVATRMRRIESIKESKSEGYGIRVFKNKQLGFCFSSDFSVSGMDEAARRAIDLSKETSSDEFNGLPEATGDFELPDLDIYDGEIGNIPMELKIEACLRAEQAMFEYDKRVTNSEGAGFYDGETLTVIANSRDQSQSYKSSFCYLICRPVAEEDGKMQGGSWFSFKRKLADLDSAESVGRTAAERTVRMLGAKVPPTAKVPVVFDNLTGTSILASILGAVNGDSVYKKATYLVGKLNQTIASPLVTLVDDAVAKKGLASAPFDGEGVRTIKREIVSKGKLLSYMYDTYTARKADAMPTANAQRDHASLPSIGSYNFYMEPGKDSFEDIIGSVKSGLYLTSLMGFGANPVTGDYSLGASGIWIEGGELAFPVEGLVVASNMLDMLKEIDMVGDDLKYLGPVFCPTFRVAEMTVSGKG